MKLLSLGKSGLQRRLAAGELVVVAGPFRYRIQSHLPRILEGIQQLYANYPVASSDEFADFSLRLEAGRGLHRFWHRQVRFSSDGECPFLPLPASHAYPQLEWAMNWCVATRAHHGLMLHAAVIERNGYVAILPAPPGSGKSTLCAALIHRGWRLLSDEVAFVSLEDGQVTPIVRPVSLKNESIDIIRRWAPYAVFTQPTLGTSKGTVTHMRAPDPHVDRMMERAPCRWIVFPKYVAGAATALTRRSRALSAIDLGSNSFNYTLLGRAGFRAVARLVAECDCYDFEYSDLNEAVITFDKLASGSMGT